VGSFLFGSLLLAIAFFPAGVPQQRVVSGIQPSTNANSCCRMASQAIFNVDVPAHADALVVTVEIPLLAAAPADTTIVARIGTMPAQRVCCLRAGIHQAAFQLPGVSSANRVLTVRLAPSNRGAPTLLLRRVMIVDTIAGTHFLNGVQVDRLNNANAWDRIDLALMVVSGIAMLALALRRRLAFIWVGLIVTDPFALAVPLGQTTITWSKVILLAALIVLVLYQIFVRRSRPPWNWRALAIAGAFLLFIASMAASSLHAHYANPALRETLKAVDYFLTFAVAAIAYSIDRDRELLRHALAILTIVVCVLALGQLWFGTSEQFAFGTHVLPRVAGPLEGPNQLGAFLGIVLPLVLALALGNQRGSRVRLRGDELAALLLGGAALVLTFSRGGIVSAAFGILLVLLLREGRRRIVATVAVIFCALACVVSVNGIVRGDTTFAKIFPSRGSDLYNGGLGTRQELWDGALQMWRQHPILGVGPGNYDLEIASYAPGVRTSANSYYLQVLSEDGVVGLLAFLLLVGVTIRVLDADDPMVIGVLAVVLAFAFHQIVDSLLLYPKVGDIFWALLAIAAAASAPFGRAGATQTDSAG
jgi:putative inorganic carbon (hco3(-)) transporter